MEYTATCKECGTQATGEMWMDVQVKGWVFLELYVDGTGETSKKIKWEWYCPAHKGEGIMDILNA